MTGQEEYPRFISNRPCGNDKYEGKSQDICHHGYICIYNIVFHFAIHLDGPAWSDAGIPAND